MKITNNENILAEEKQLMCKIEAGVFAAAALARRDFSQGTAAELNQLVLEGQLAQEDFISKQLGLVRWVIGTSPARFFASYQDLYSEGLVGVMQALKRFDYRKGLRFSTYAVPWIRYQINSFSQKFYNGHEVPVPDFRDEIKEDDTEQNQGLQEALGKIDPEIERIIRWRFGIDCEKRTLQDLARSYGVSTTKIMAWQKQGIAQLREVLSVV